MIYLVTGRIRVTPYMNDSRIVKCSNLVEADDIHEAESKFIKFWEDKSVDYGTNYSTYDVDVSETIT